MRKLIALMAMVLLVMGAVPLAFAEEGSGENAKEVADDAEDSDDPDDDSSAMSDDNLPKMMKINNSGPRLGMMKNQSERKEMMQEGKERMKEARENFREARDRYNETKEQFKEARDALKESQEQARKACRINNSSEDCKQFRDEITAQSKEFLVSSADRILNMLEQIKEKVTAADAIDTERQATIIADLDESIANVEAAKAKAEALDEDSTKEEYKEVAEELREAWKDAKKHSKLGLGRLNETKIDAILSRFALVQVKIASTIDQLAAAGYDTVALEINSQKLSEEVASAQANFEKAKELYDQAVSADEVDTLVGQANEYIQAAHQDLREAHSILKEILDEIKEAQRSLNSDDTNQTEGDDNVQ